MSLDLTGITNKNEYYTNHYFSTVFEENASSTISGWNAAAKETEGVRTPWSLLRQNARQFYVAHDRFSRSTVNLQTLANIKTMADKYLFSLGYPEAKPEMITVDDTLSVPVYLEMTKSNGAPLLWVILSASKDVDAGILEANAYNPAAIEEDAFGALPKDFFNEMPNDDLATKILFASAEPPRFLMFIGMNQIALIDRNKWNEKKYLQFELEEIFSRLENTTLQAMSVLLHRESLCPDDGKILLDELDEQSQKNASGVSQDLKFALRECIELLGNEVLYDMAYRTGRDLDTDPVDAGQLTLECLRYMYRMLFVLFIESRPELGYAPIKVQSYYSGYSLESLRDIADNIRDDVDEVGDGYYLHETLAKLYDLIYNGYPKTEEELKQATGTDSLHDMFLIAPLKAHIFDPEYTAMITAAKLRNRCMLRIIDLMSLTRSTGKKNGRRGRISYANLGINQMGSVYEALLSYRGFIAEHDLYEVKRAGDSFNELDVGYFVSESELDQYTEDERVRYEHGEKKGKLRMYEKGTFIYRLAGREREKSASYYTPEVLTKCLVKYALKELLEGKTADEILELTICEPAMGSAAFLNEAINQLAEAYISCKEKETGEIISYEKRFNELQKVKMFIADRNVYGIDLNPVAVELAEVSLWLNTIYEGGFVPWFGTQLVNGNSLIGARRQVYRIDNAQSTSKGMRWYEMEPERLPFGTARADKGYKFGRKQIYHFLLGDPGMCNYTDKVIKALKPDAIKSMVNWNKKFIEPITDDDVITLLRLSAAIDDLWEAQIRLRKEVGAKTQDTLSIFGHTDDAVDSRTTIRQKDKIYSELYKSEHMRNAGPYARLKFAMDYWCALWFWPIDKADLLPTRSEFLFDMSLILEGTMASVNVTDSIKGGQLSLFPTEMEQLALNIIDTYGTETIVDIPRLRKENQRLDLVAQIAEKNRFVHWELEFADLFADRGGFDLVVGNPPWVKVWWNEQSLISDHYPLSAIRKLKASEVSKIRSSCLGNSVFAVHYYSEYAEVGGMQNYLNATQNYPALKGSEVNLYKYFLPQSWQFSNFEGIFAFVHPSAIYDEAKGGTARSVLYTKLRKCYKFVNEAKLFAEVGNTVKYSLCIYSNTPTKGFDLVCEIHRPNEIEEAYDQNNTRLMHIDVPELKLFAAIFDNSEQYKEARIPSLKDSSLLNVLRGFQKCTNHVFDLKEKAFGTTMWSETDSVESGLIVADSHFPENGYDSIITGPLIGLSNPVYQSAKRICDTHRAFDNVDLTAIPEEFFTRCKYRPTMTKVKFNQLVPRLNWGVSYADTYKILLRRRLGQNQERTLLSAIFTPGVTHVNTVTGVTCQNLGDLVLLQGQLSSLIFDGYIKILKKDDLYFEGVSKMPLLCESEQAKDIVIRTLMLNCITKQYALLWNSCIDSNAEYVHWAKKDVRLQSSAFTNTPWTYTSACRGDFQRRQLQVEIDVLVAMAMGISLNTLKNLYKIQFPVMQDYEVDTWYDANGRIAFTTNRSLSGVGFSRAEFENGMKNASAGAIFTKTISDDTMPGGPVERTIEYIAPFDRCDREKDYETAWKYFEQKYGK